MKIFRRNFIKTFFLSLPVLFLMKFDLLSSRSKKNKLKKNKNFVLYLNNND